MIGDCQNLSRFWWLETHRTYFHLQPLDDPLGYVWRGLRALMISLESKVDKTQMSWYLVLEIRLRSVGRHGRENLALQNLEVSVLPQGLLRVKEEQVSLPPSLRETAPHGHSLGDPESLAEILWQESRLSTDTPDPPGTHRRQHTEGGLIGEQTSAPILFGPVAVFCTESMGRHIQTNWKISPTQ